MFVLWKPMKTPNYLRGLRFEQIAIKSNLIKINIRFLFNNYFYKYIFNKDTNNRNQLRAILLPQYK